MRIAFMYSGQGAQEPGMMSDLYASYDSSREVFEVANRVLGRNIADLCFNGTEDELNLTHNTQPCVLAADLAAAAALEESGIHPDAVAGFSLGEYAALTRAGVFAVEDAFQIAQIRADAMQKAVPIGKGAMAAILGGSVEDVESLCAEAHGYVVPANFNSPAQTVVSGTAAGVEELVELAACKGLGAVKLDVSAPFHCSLMEPAAKAIEKEFENVSFVHPALPVYMNVTAEVLSSLDDVAELLVRQAMNAVRWQQTLMNMKRDGVDTFIECGPGKTLWGLCRHTLSGVTTLRVGDEMSLKKTLKVLNGE